MQRVVLTRVVLTRVVLIRVVLALVTSAAALTMMGPAGRASERHCSCVDRPARPLHVRHYARYRHREYHVVVSRWREIKAEPFGGAPASPWPTTAGVSVPPENSTFDRAMMDYLHSPELTGYRNERRVALIPGVPVRAVPTASVVVPATAAATVPTAAPVPLILSVRPYRILAGNTVYEYDTGIGNYVAVAAPDASASIAVAMASAMRAAPPPIITPAP